MAEFRPTFARIDLSALRHNFSVLRGVAPKSWMCAMVKGDAYGHGATVISKELEKLKVDALGVSLVEEGMALRTAGIQCQILVFGWFSDASARACLTHQMTPVISRWRDLETFAGIAGDSALGIHLKFNTGMNRLGFNPGEAGRLARFTAGKGGLKVTGICSHLAKGEDWADPAGESAAQAARLRSAAAEFPTVKCIHLLNSAAILSGDDLEGFGIRPGIALYGAGNYPGSGAAKLRPVMSFCSQVGAIHDLSEGEGVSYNLTWRAKRSGTRIAVVPVGYADGLMRLLSNRGHALIRGQRVPIVGIVCMDYIMLDLTSLASHSSVESGEPVVLWGQLNGNTLGVDEVADLAQTIAYELLTGVGPRVPRRFENGD